MIIGIDLDGVIRNFVDKVIEVYRKHYTNHEVPITRKVYNIALWFPIGDKIYDFVFNKHAKEIYQEAKPYPKAKKFLEYLKEDGHKIIFVTNQPNEKTKAATLKWIEKNRMPHDDIKFTADKDEVEADILLDDYVKNLQEFAEAGKLAVCFDRPWNKEWNGPRVKTYEKFIELIKQWQPNE